jgi:hypothetical protein
MRKVWIAIPAYSGQIHLPTMRSVLTDLLAFQARGDAVTIFDESGNAMIADCRAVIVAQFLASDATDLIFVDSDVVWEAGTLLKLVDAPVDFVAAIYPQRKDPINYAISWLDKPDLIAENGLLEVAGVPAGCMRLSRSMLEKMVAAYPDTQFHCETAPNNTANALFDPYRIGKLKFGEDYSFCRRWRDIGGKVWIDPEIKMGHVGNKTFQGNIGEWLRNRNVEA